MRKLIIFCLAFIVSQLHAVKITLDIPADEIAVVQNDVVDAEDWIRAAWKGKVEKCSSRIVDAETKLSIERSESIPAGQQAIVEKYLSRPGYKNRKEREKLNPK